MQGLILQPISFVVLRAILGLAIGLLCLREKASRGFILCFLLGFGTDAIDGMVARHCHTGSVATAMLDGTADVCLYSGSLIYLKKFYWPIIRPYFKLKMLVLFQFLAWGICGVKFGRISSWHSYMAKIFGLAIVAAVVNVTVSKNSQVLRALILIGVIYLADDIAITLIMPYWRVGVMSAFDALGYMVSN